MDAKRLGIIGSAPSGWRVMSVTDEIKDRVDIVDLVSESVELRRAGRNFTGFCPFHHNVNTPSFVVFPDTQTWKCFGECDEGGDVFNFVMKKEGWEFAEALRSLADRAGIVLKPLTPEAREEQEEGEPAHAPGEREPDAAPANGYGMQVEEDVAEDGHGPRAAVAWDAVTEDRAPDLGFPDVVGDAREDAHTC